MGAWAKGNPGGKARAANHKTRDVGPNSQGGNPLRASDAEARALGVDPDVWICVQTYWAGTHARNEKATLVGYGTGYAYKAMPIIAQRRWATHRGHRQ